MAKSVPTSTPWLSGVPTIQQTCFHFCLHSHHSHLLASQSDQVSLLFALKQHPLMTSTLISAVVSPGKPSVFLFIARSVPELSHIFPPQSTAGCVFLVYHTGHYHQSQCVVLANWFSSAGSQIVKIETCHFFFSFSLEG